MPLGTFLVVGKRTEKQVTCPSLVKHKPESLKHINIFRNVGDWLRRWLPTTDEQRDKRLRNQMVEELEQQKNKQD